MKSFSFSSIFIFLYFLISNSLSTEYKFNISILDKFINKISIRPLNIFSSFDFQLDSKCEINPKNYYKSPNVIFNCGFLENQFLLITFIKKDKRVNIYSKENEIDKLIIKIGENNKIKICINKNNGGELTKFCGSVTFWVINDYETLNGSIITNNKETFDDDHLLKFLGDRDNNKNETNINYVVLEEVFDGKTNKNILSPKDGLITYDIKYNSTVTLHIPQNQHKTTNLLQELNKNNSNPSIIYFIDSNRIGYGPLSINIKIPQIINSDGPKEIKRSFLLNTLNKNNNKRAFVLFVFNFIEDKITPKDCLEVIINDSTLKGIIIRDNTFKLPSTIIQCGNNTIPVDITNPDGTILYEIKLLDKNNNFLYYNGILLYHLDQLQESGYYQHQLFLKPGQNEFADYTVKDINKSQICHLRFSFKSALCDRYVYYLSFITKYLSYAAAFINFKSAFQLWLFNELVTNINEVPNEVKIISGNNNLVKKYDFLFKLFKSVNIKYKEDEKVFYSFLASILINLSLLSILIILKYIKKHKKSKILLYNRSLQIIASFTPYGLILSLAYSFLIIFNVKGNITIFNYLLPNTIAVSAVWILLSLFLFLLSNNIGKKVIDSTFTYSPWLYNNQLLNFPELPFYPTIKWQLESLGDSSTMKIDVGNSYFLIEYKLNLPDELELKNDFYKLTIISATFNDLKATSSPVQVNERHIFLLNTPAAWIRTSLPSNNFGDEDNKIFSILNLYDIFILYIRKHNRDFYIHYSQCSQCYDYNILLSLIIWVASYFINIQYRLFVLIVFSLLIKFTDLKKSADKKFIKERFKHNIFLSGLMKILSHGIIIGLLILKFTLSNKSIFKQKTIKQLSVLSSLLMFSSLLPNITIFFIWLKYIFYYINKLLINFIFISFLYIKIKLINNIQALKNENINENIPKSQFTNFIENSNSGSAVITNAIFNAAKPLTELNILNFKLLYKNIPLDTNAFYKPSAEHKKLIYYYGELDELPLTPKFSKLSTLNICVDTKFSTNASLNNFFATIEITRPPRISKLLPEAPNNFMSLNIDLPKFAYENNNKLYDLIYDDAKHLIKITGPFIVPSGVFTVKAVIKNGYQSDSDSDPNFVTSIIADTCRCNYHGILHVPISPDYIDFLSLHNKIHIWKYSKEKTIPFYIYPNMTYVEINKTTKMMILRDQKFIEGSIYKVQYKCLPNKTDVGFTEMVIADDNLSRITIPVPIPQKSFNYMLYEYHVTNSVNITYSISPQNDINWGFHDEYILNIIRSNPKVWGLTNILDYKIPCIINANIKNDIFRVTPKYNIALSVAKAQYEELMAVYSTLIFNRNNSLEFVGFFWYIKEEINTFFGIFGINLYINNFWINPFSDELIKIYGQEKMQNAFNSLYTDLKYKLEFVTNLSEQIITYLQEMNSLYNQEVLLDAIDAFDKLIINGAPIESVQEIVLKRVSRDISPNLLKKLLFPPIISAQNIKWNFHLSSQLDAWKAEIKNFFENQIGFSNSFSMLTSSYAAPLEYSLSCLANSLRRLTDGSNAITHIVITEKSLISFKNPWDIQPNYLHTTSFNALLGYIKINDNDDLSDVWCPAFFYWKPDGILFDIINVDQFYLKFKDITAIEFDQDVKFCQNEPGIFNFFFSSDELKTVILSCKIGESNILNSNILYKKTDDYKLYFKTTAANNKFLSVILTEANVHTDRENNTNTIQIDKKEEIEEINSLDNLSESDLDYFLYERFESSSESEKTEVEEVIL